MFNRKIIFILIVLVIAMGTVSANDLNSTDTVAVDNQQEIVDTALIEEESLSSTKTVTGNTFEDIQSTIDSTEDGDTIELSGLYTGSGNPIRVNKTVTIAGKEDTIMNAKNESYILFIQKGNVMIKNICFANGFFSFGGAIFSQDKCIEVSGCSFINCTSYHKAGAIYTDNDETLIRNCEFRNCSAESGGAIEGGRAYNCTFEDCHAEEMGGAVKYTAADFCFFKDCDIDEFGGGAMYKGSASNCVFINCHAKDEGGAISLANATNCTFINCSASELGNVMFGSSAVNCYFKGNSEPECYESNRSGDASQSPVVNAKVVLTQSGKYYQNKILTFRLTNLYNNSGIANERIFVTFSNGNTVTLKTGKNGMVSYKVGFTPGTYSASARLSNDAYNCGETKLSNIKISKAPARLTPTKLTTTYASGKCFKVKLTNSKTGLPISGIRLKLKVYTGKRYITKTVTTNSKGIAKYSASALKVGTHKVITSVKDSKYASAASKKSSIKIKKAPYRISAPKAVGVYKKSTTLKVTVKNKASGKAVKGVKVTFKVYTGKKYRTYTAKTNKNGVAKISSKSWSLGVHKVTAKAKATKSYKAASKKGSIKIVKSKMKTSSASNKKASSNEKTVYKKTDWI
ncbi:Ig-like domain-containing protein [Methanobrevibacter sp.]|uniref:Ig-like domain-containing protein n=1 Tax=Methanobrevibacter sp. TaxID=66852 RepID=UPI00386F66E1